MSCSDFLQVMLFDLREPLEDIYTRDIAPQEDRSAKWLPGKMATEGGLFLAGVWHALYFFIHSAYLGFLYFGKQQVSWIDQKLDKL